MITLTDKMYQTFIMQVPYFGIFWPWLIISLLRQLNEKAKHKPTLIPLSWKLPDGFPRRRVWINKLSYSRVYTTHRKGRRAETEIADRSSTGYISTWVHHRRHHPTLKDVTRSQLIACRQRSRETKWRSRGAVCDRKKGNTGQIRFKLFLRWKISTFRWHGVVKVNCNSPTSRFQF